MGSVNNIRRTKLGSHPSLSHTHTPACPGGRCGATVRRRRPPAIDASPGTAGSGKRPEARQHRRGTFAHHASALAHSAAAAVILPGKQAGPSR